MDAPVAGRKRFAKLAHVGAHPCNFVFISRFGLGLVLRLFHSMRLIRAASSSLSMRSMPNSFSMPK